MKWLVAAALATAPLWAQTAGTLTRERGYWVQIEEGAVPAPGLHRLRISSVGSVTLRGEAGDQVRYLARKRVRAGSEAEARRLLERASVRASRQGPAFTLAIPDLDCVRCSYSVDLSVTAPRTAEETVLQTNGGAVQVRHLAGRVNAETAGGSIEMDDIGREVRAATAGGSITLGTIGGAVRCETAGGSIRLAKVGGEAILTTSGGDIEAAVVSGRLRAETAGGSIRARSVGQDVVAGTAGGSIEIGSVGGMVSAETAGGSITVESAPRGVRAENANGSIRLLDVAGVLRASTAAGNILAQLMANHALADSLIETANGTIVVLIPAGMRLTVRAAVDVAGSASRIQSDFPDIVVRLHERGPGPRTVVAEGALNGGGPVLRIHNTSGTIQIKRR
jgi:hypothetical protein